MKNIYTFLFLSIFISNIYGQGVSLEWVVQTGNQNSKERSSGTVVDQFGNVYTIGYFELTVDFDPGPGIANLTAQANRDAFIRKLDTNGNFLWVKQVSGNGEVNPRDIYIDQHGDIYITGFFRGTIDLDPGPGVQLAVSTGNSNSTNTFVQKLNASGSLIWSYWLDAKVAASPDLITSDSFGNIYLTGTFVDSVDFDPSPTSTELLVANSTKPEIFIQKLDANLDYLWTKKIRYTSSGLSNALSISSLTVAPSGNIYSVGHFRDTVDFDPDTSDFLLTAVNHWDGFIHKMSASGNFIWVKQLGNTGRANFYDSYLDSAEQITFAGSFSGLIDLDPDSGIVSYDTGSESYSDMFIQRLDSSGKFVWAKTIEAADQRNLGLAQRGFVKDTKGNFYLIGVFSKTVDFDPGQGVFTLTAEPDRDNRSTFLVKCDKDANFIWATHISAASSSHKLMAIDKLDNIYINSTFIETVDFDPNQGIFELSSPNGFSIYALKFNQSCSGLSLVMDEVRDITCTSLGSASGHAVGGTPPFVYSWSSNPQVNDSSSSFSFPGIYTLHVEDSLACRRTSSILLGGKDFTQSPGLTTNLTSTGYRPGRSSTIWVDAFNGSCTPFTGELVLVLDPLVQFDAASVPPDRINGDSLIWNLTNITYDSGHFQSSVYVTSSLNAMIGDRVCFDLTIPRKGGSTQTKSAPRNYCFDVVNSYDPNDKQVYPQGDCAANYIQKDERITYTVRFQNTGNADAIDIFILDTLDTHLMIDSVKIVGQSHEPMITEILENNVLKFRFDNINLADSNSNEKLSHGYVMYEINAQEGLTDGIIIENEAAIFFDFNDPVITNSVNNTLLEVLPIIDTTELFISSCGSYRLNNRVYEQNGTYFQKLLSSQACDSVIKLNFTTYLISEIDTSLSMVGGTLKANEMNATYQWIDCGKGGIPIMGATNQLFTPEENGLYAVIIDNGNCSFTSTCINMTQVAIDQELKNALSYFPNPTSGTMELNLGYLYNTIEINITNLLGQNLSIQTFEQKEIVTIQVPEKSGLYLVQINADGRTAVMKVMKN